MKKKLISVLICAAMTAALAAGCGSTEPAGTPDGSGDAANTPAKPDKVYTITVTQHDPEASSTGEFLNNWAAEIEEKSGGAIDVQVHHGGTIAGPKDSIDAVLNGTVDVAWGNQAFYTGQFPVTSVFTIPGLDIERATQGSEAFWNFYNNYDYLDAEYSQYHVLFLHVNCSSPIATTNTKIETVEDMKGMKLRGNSGPPADFVTALGASAEACAIGDLYSNLDKGVYDGCITDWHAIESFKLYETVEYILDVNVGCSTYFLLMNQDSYAKLPADLQKIVDEVSADAGKYTETWDVCEDRVRAMDGVKEKLYTLSDEENAKLRAIEDKIIEKWIADTENGQEIFDAVTKELEAAKK